MRTYARSTQDTLGAGPPLRLRAHIYDLSGAQDPESARASRAARREHRERQSYAQSQRDCIMAVNLGPGAGWEARCSAGMSCRP